MRECRRDISKSSGAFGARSQDLPYWFLDAEQERRSRRDRARARALRVVTAVVIIIIIVVWRSRWPAIVVIVVVPPNLRRARWTSARSCTTDCIAEGEGKQGGGAGRRAHTLPDAAHALETLRYVECTCTSVLLLVRIIGSLFTSRNVLPLRAREKKLAPVRDCQ